MATIEKPKMTCLQLTMAVMLNMLGSSIILMPTKLAEVGTQSILAQRTQPVSKCNSPVIRAVLF